MFLAKDPLQFARCGKLPVAPRGRDRDVHATVAPTEQQLAIIAAGGGVYWLDGQQVLVPYGVHNFTHTPRDDEDWNFTDWRRRKEWHKDWRISHPVPEPDATRWGLVPLALHQMTSTKATFSLTEARDIMQRLEDVQRARWRRRRADARELHAARHTPPPQHPAPSPPASDVAASERPAPATPAVPETSPSGTPAGESPCLDPAIERTGASENTSAALGAPAPDAEPVRPAAPPTPAPAVPPPPAHPPHMPPAPATTEDPVRRGGLRGVLRRFLGRR
ncbi:hypothetical protein [Streptomyces kronopolitis]|uniref:hypothetical protein n=1 Tax=Streptomyces kronopolitis TaxID=1612435 RepID=UPI0020BF1173|nr:hypothetical protein [Streptomyces kronopolitis]MCL6299510.1 hypothetical protein [Streptomyces kronopolitis]